MLTITSEDLTAQVLWLEALVKRHLEELHFSFDTEPLDDLAGFLIGDRLVLTATREVVPQPLERTVLFTVTQEQADDIASRSTLYHAFGLRQP